MRCSVCKEDFSVPDDETIAMSGLCVDCEDKTEDSFIFQCINCGSCDVINREAAIISALDHTSYFPLMTIKNENVIIRQESCNRCSAVHAC
ncbi:MAG: hypothetical protein VST72_04460 [Nitrospirota bacterium]|nr:hypothetical protein [Nitrospirota bacterium]